MKWCVWQIQEDSGTKLLLKTTPEQPPQKVLTVSQTSRLLKRSRRQIYRYIRESRLTSYGKFLGEWLLNKEEVIRMASFPAHPHALPKSFRPMFPEYDLKDLNPGRDRVLVLSRLLEQGSRRELRWIFQRYKKREILNFLMEDGARLLSPRTLNFWQLYFGIQVQQLPHWRRQVWDYGAAV